MPSQESYLVQGCLNTFLVVVICCFIYNYANKVSSPVEKFQLNTKITEFSAQVLYQINRAFSRKFCSF